MTPYSKGRLAMSPMTNQIHLNALIVLLLWLGLALLGHQLAGLLHTLQQTDSGSAATHQARQSDAGPPAVLLLNGDALVTAINSGEATFTARVRDGKGKPVANVMVSFQSDQGTVTPATAQTDASGAVSATFRAGAMAGPARVTATAGDFSQTATLQIVQPASNQQHTLALALGTGQLPSEQSTALTIQLRDAAGQPVAGELVTFFGALGTVTPTSAVTDANGRATARFQAGRIAGQGLISALAGAATHSASIQVGERVIPPPAEADHALYLPLVSR